MINIQSKLTFFQRKTLLAYILKYELISEIKRNLKLFNYNAMMHFYIFIGWMTQLYDNELLKAVYFYNLFTTSANSISVKKL